MKNLYNKGPYRFYEYGHIRPYLKRQGNKRWRKMVVKEIDEQLNNNAINFRAARKGRKKRKNIKVKITERRYGNLKYSEIRRYACLRDAENAIRRNCVIRYTFIN